MKKSDIKKEAFKEVIVFLNTLINDTNAIVKLDALNKFLEKKINEGE